MKAEKQQKEPQKAETVQPKREGAKLSFVDNRPEVIAQAKLIDAIHKYPIQMYALGTGVTRTVDIKGKNNNHSFEECIYNYVEYQKDDHKQQGTATSSPASWAGWLVNSGRTRNATQLHIVNNRWGGLGGQSDKNIVPGSPSENSHHYHQAEVFFDEYCFGGSAGQIALHNCRYECLAQPAYGTSIDVSNGAENFDDPVITVKITNDSDYVQDYSPLSGTGLTVKDGSLNGNNQ